MDTVRKVLDCEVVKESDFKFTFTASTGDEDRDGEVIEASGWDLKPFKKNPVIMYAHDYRSLPIGRATKVWITGGKLKNTVEFPEEGINEFADGVRRLVEAGFLKTESVGFIPKKWEDGDEKKGPKRRYIEQELLEISIVPVPSNPNALADAVNQKVITTKQFDMLTKPEETDSDTNIEIPKEKEVSQEQIQDDVDYLISNLEKYEANDSTKEQLWNLVRFTGDDIPEEIILRLGAVINKQHRDRLVEIVSLVDEILTSATVLEDDEPEDEKPEKSTVGMEEIIALVKDTVKELIDEARGKVK